jgi:D-alanyl-D-alanine carboxypeptidase
MGVGRLIVSMLTLLALSPAAAVAGPTLLFEAGSGKVLYAEDQDHYWHPASLTKIMTAYVAFEAIREGRITPETKLVCSETASKEPPSKIGLPVGAEMTVALGLKALIVKSANDVAVMLAETIGGNVDGFVQKMNATARKLGMSRTHFVNPNGLPAPQQVTTARDLAKLARAVIRDYPEYAELWAMPVVQIGKMKLASHNSLLRTFEGADGLKTGFICDSGFNVVASATRDGTRLMAVVLGEPTPNERALRAASLLEHGFQHYGWKNFFNTTDLDSLPMSIPDKGVMSVRQSVLSWDCGYRPQKAAARILTLKSRAARAKQRQKAKQDGKQEATAAGAAPAKASASAPSAAKPAAASAATVTKAKPGGSPTRPAAGNAAAPGKAKAAAAGPEQGVAKP